MSVLITQQRNENKKLKHIDEVGEGQVNRLSSDVELYIRELNGVGKRLANISDELSIYQREYDTSKVEFVALLNEADNRMSKMRAETKAIEGHIAAIQNRINNTKVRMNEMQDSVDMTRLASKVLKHNIDEGGVYNEKLKAKEQRLERSIEMVQHRRREMLLDISERMNQTSRPSRIQVHKHDNQRAERSVDTPKAMYRRDMLLREIEPFQISSKTLSKQLIGEKTKLNAERHGLINDYVNRMEHLDRSFTKLRSEGSETGQEGMVETLTRNAEQSGELGRRLMELDVEINRYENAIATSKDTIVEGVKLTARTKRQNELVTMRERETNKQIDESMTIMSQQNSKVDVEIQAVRRYMQIEYCDWYDKGASRHVFRPVEKEIASSIGSSEPFLGFFETLFSKLIIYNRYINPEPVFESSREKEKEDDDTLRKTGDHYDNSDEDGLKKKKIKVNGYREGDLMDIKLDLGTDGEEEFYSKQQRGLLDLVKLRSKNRSFFDEESATNRPTTDRLRTKRGETTRDTNNNSML